MKQFSSGQQIEDIDRKVRGGAAVVIETPAEFESVEALCAIANIVHPGNPLAAIYQGIADPDFALRASEYRAFARGTTELVSANISDVQPITRSMRDMTELRRMFQIAKQVRDSLDAKEKDELSVVFAVPRPRWHPFAKLRMTAGSPALAIHQGSVIGRVLCGPIKLAGTLIGFFLKKGIAHTRQMKVVIEETRARAALKGRELPKLDDQNDVSMLRGKEAVVILVHGLMGIDVGTFDGLINTLTEMLAAEVQEAIPLNQRVFEELEKRIPQRSILENIKFPITDIRSLRSNAVSKAREEVLAFAGWPHDTLTDIESNGLQLAECIQQLVAIDGDLRNGPDILFACHSRGGLVARSTMTKLIARDPRWREKIKGCVTFGTPHTGAELAEVPGRFAGHVLMCAMLNQTRSVYALPAALHALCQGQAQGIEDLRPPSGGGQFLKNLLNEEAAAHLAPEANAVPLFSVGGAYRASGARTWMATHAFGNAPNDWVVATESSAPPRYSEREEVQCHHFGYFETPSSRAINFISRQLALPQRIEREARNALASKYL